MYAGMTIAVPSKRIRFLALRANTKYFLVLLPSSFTLPLARRSFSCRYINNGLEDADGKTYPDSHPAGYTICTLFFG
jgi:hypothetical protein